MNDFIENSLDIVSDYCDNKFFKSKDKSCKKLIVLLPSVNSKGHHPYFPRISWARDLSNKYNVLYVSDPYQHLPEYKEPMGSWFISPEGNSTLPKLAIKINEVKSFFGFDDILYYGSSMGGYAAICLSALCEGSKAVAECPQIFLENHPGSRYVSDNILNETLVLSDIEPIKYLVNGRCKSLKVMCSIFDHHYSSHILPFIEILKSSDSLIDVNVDICFFMDKEYKKGHVALNKRDALRVIDSMMY